MKPIKGKSMKAWDDKNYFEKEVCREELKKRFLTGTDESGRFIVFSQATHISYYVEPIDRGHSEKWGDIDPATKRITGEYGNKHEGSIKPEESLITEDNGFVNISEVKGSPLSVIYERDREYERQMKEGTYKNPNQNR